MTSATVKLGFGPEVHRFSVDPTTSFSELLTVIEEVIHGLPVEFAVKYEDDEAEFVTINSDRELAEAFNLAENNVLRLQVVAEAVKNGGNCIPSYKKFKEALLKLLLPPVPDAPKQIAPAPVDETPADTEEVPASDEATAEEQLSEVEVLNLEEEEQPLLDEAPKGVYHEAYCNNCGKDIYNIRYKCGNCDDFDLCESCEELWSTDLSIHNEEHIFLKIYRPISTKYTQSFLNNLYEDSEDETSEDESEEEDSEETSSSSSESEEEEEEEETDSESEAEHDETTSEEEESPQTSPIEDVAELEHTPSEVVQDLPPFEPMDESLPVNTQEGEERVPEETDSSPEPTEESTAQETEQRKEPSVSSFLKALQRFVIGSDRTTHSPEELPALLARLEEMGFSNKERNQELLEEKDDICAVLDELLA